MKPSRKFRGQTYLGLGLKLLFSPTPRMNSLPARWKKESRGWGGGIISDGQDYILFASCPSVLLLGSESRPCSGGYRQCLGVAMVSGNTEQSLLRWGLSASSLFPPFPQSWEGRRRMTSQKTQSDEDGSHLDLQSPRKPCWLTPVVSEARQDSLVSSRPA